MGSTGADPAGWQYGWTVLGLARPVPVTIGSELVQQKTRGAIASLGFLRNRNHSEDYP
jgi:hypothetical protein